MPTIIARDSFGEGVRITQSSTPFLDGLDLTFESERPTQGPIRIFNYTVDNLDTVARAQVTYRYPDNGRTILREFTLTTETGEVAFSASELFADVSDDTYPTHASLFSGIDRIFTGGFDDVLRGFAGDDQLSSSGGDDRVFGGSGNDILNVGTGNDRVWGGQGDDLLYGLKGQDRLSGGSGQDEMYGGKGGDVVSGGIGADRVYAGGGDDIVRGGQGRDRLDGGDKDDVLSGGKGQDMLEGKGGDDLLTGGRGEDTLIGGRGADIFQFAAGDGRDRLLNFEADADRLRFDTDLRGTLEISFQNGDTHIGYGDQGDVLILVDAELGFRDIAIGFSELS